MKDTLQTWSVLGDSISTFRGYTPSGGVFYGPENGAFTGVYSAEDTWWMRVIQARHGVLLANDSWSGSTVSEGGPVPAVSPSRIRRLGRDGLSPDALLVFTGLNDWALYVEVSRFEEAYRQMLRTIRQYHPNTILYCGTFPGGHFPANPGVPSMGAIRREVYNEAIRSAARAPGCRLADLAASGETYESIDGIHPTGRGMEQLAHLWLAALRAL